MRTLIRRFQPGCNVCCAAPVCPVVNGDAYSDAFSGTVLNTSWTPENTTVQWGVSGGVLQAIANTGAAAAQLQQVWSGSTPVEVRIECDVDDTNATTPGAGLLGIGWDDGGSNTWLFSIEAQYSFPRFLIRHNGTTVTGLPGTPSGVHKLSMKIVDVGGGVVESTFCVDDVQIGVTYSDTYTLATSTKYGVNAIRSSSYGDNMGEFDDFASDVDV